MYIYIYIYTIYTVAKICSFSISISIFNQRGPVEQREGLGRDHRRVDRVRLYEYIYIYTERERERERERHIYIYIYIERER